jgi:hypothetical protein
MMSVTLPAPNGTTIVTLWVGKACAQLETGAAIAAAVRTIASMRKKGIQTSHSILHTGVK